MKTTDALKLAGIVFAGVAAYLVITKAAKAGGDLKKGVQEAVAAVTEPVKKAIKDAVEGDKTLPPNDPYSKPAGFDRYWQWVKNFWGIDDTPNPSNLQKQGEILLPPTGAGGGQSSPEFAARDPRRLDRPASFSNPLESADTQDFNAMGDYPFTFGR